MNSSHIHTTRHWRRRQVCILLTNLSTARVFVSSYPSKSLGISAQFTGKASRRSTEGSLGIHQIWRNFHKILPMDEKMDSLACRSMSSPVVQGSWDIGSRVSCQDIKHYWSSGGSETHTESPAAFRTRFIIASPSRSSLTSSMSMRCTPSFSRIVATPMQTFFWHEKTPEFRVGRGHDADLDFVMGVHKRL